MLLELLKTLGQTLNDVLPIVSILLVFQLLVLRQPIANLPRIGIGVLYVLFGISLFLQGLEQALFPIGKLMASQLTSPPLLPVVEPVIEAGAEPGAVVWSEYYWIYLFAFLIGFSTTIAEPSLIAVAMKANQVSGGAIGVWGLRLSVAVGVAVGITLGCMRIVMGWSLPWFIISGYILVMIQTLFAPKLIVPLAYDSGGVTTSTVTVPLVAALGLGLASAIPGRSPMLDGFGLIAFASLFPMLSVMTYAQIIEALQQRRERKEQEQNNAQLNEPLSEVEAREQQTATAAAEPHGPPQPQELQDR